jgi:hypothetical protein
MSQHRISIPYVYTKIYSDQEFKVLVESTKEKAKLTGYVLLGLSLAAAEVVTRHTTNVLQESANILADVHDEITRKQVVVEADKLAHVWTLTKESEVA